MVRKTVSRDGEVWTKDEVRQLRKVFGNNSNATVAGLLGRSVKAVEHKAARLGLRKTKTYLRSIGRPV